MEGEVKTGVATSQEVGGEEGFRGIASYRKHGEGDGNGGGGGGGGAAAGAGQSGPYLVPRFFVFFFCNVLSSLGKKETGFRPTLAPNHQPVKI